MTEHLAVELHDAFGTIVASGKIAVRPEALRYAERVECDEAAETITVWPGRQTQLREQPELLRAILASNYVQDRALNPRLPLYIVVSADG